MRTAGLNNLQETVGTRGWPLGSTKLALRTFHDRRSCCAFASAANRFDFGAIFRTKKPFQSCVRYFVPAPHSIRFHLPPRSCVVHGFTVIELLVVLAALALLLSVATPTYLQHLDTAREVTLKEDLHQLRDAIDKFYSDQARYPANLEELVVRRYLRALPEDPLTQRVDSWVLIAPPSPLPGAVYEVRSGAKGSARDGSRYETW